jgi:hypothetical protein
MRTIDAVADIGNVGKDLEAMQEAGRNIEVSKRVVIEYERLLPTKSRRGLPDVDEDIVDSTAGAANQLRLPSAGAAVHAANDSLDRTRLGILQKRGTRSGPTDVLIEDRRVKGPGEQSTVVAKRLRAQNENVRQIRVLDEHKAMLP